MLETGAFSRSAAVHLALTGVDFEVRDPPELMTTCAASRSDSVAHVQYDRFMSAWSVYSIFLRRDSVAQPKERTLVLNMLPACQPPSPQTVFVFGFRFRTMTIRQRITNLRIESSVPYRVATDELGNQILNRIQQATIGHVKFDCVRKESASEAAIWSRSHWFGYLDRAELARWLAPIAWSLDDTFANGAEVASRRHAHAPRNGARRLPPIHVTVKYDKTASWGGDIFTLGDVPPIARICHLHWLRAPWGSSAILHRFSSERGQGSSPATIAGPNFCRSAGSHDAPKPRKIQRCDISSHPR
jgi:hypothetical protein